MPRIELIIRDAWLSEKIKKASFNDLKGTYFVVLSDVLDFNYTAYSTIPRTCIPICSIPLLYFAFCPLLYSSYKQFYAANPSASHCRKSKYTSSCIVSSDPTQYYRFSQVSMFTAREKENRSSTSRLAVLHFCSDSRVFHFSLDPLLERTTNN